MIIATAVLAVTCDSAQPQSASTPQPTQSTAAAIRTATPAARTAEPPPIVIESVIGPDDIALVITYASGVSTADGLAAEDADGGGFVSWSRTV